MRRNQSSTRRLGQYLRGNAPHAFCYLRTVGSRRGRSDLCLRPLATENSITCLILVALFAVQRRGTGGIGAIFGPVTVLWFISIATVVRTSDVTSDLSRHFVG